MFRHIGKTVSRISALHTAGGSVWRHISVVLLRRGALSCHGIRLLISILLWLAVVVSGTLLAVTVWLRRLVAVLGLPSGRRIAAALHLTGLLITILRSRGLITALWTIVVLISTLAIAILRHTARPAGIGSAVICLLTSFIMLFASMSISQLLSAPEYYDNFIYDVNGDIVGYDDPIPNPDYPRGLKRELLLAANDVLPSGQALQVSQMYSDEFEFEYRLPLYSLAIIVLFTGTGIALFRKKDLK